MDILLFSFGIIAALVSLPVIRWILKRFVYLPNAGHPLRPYTMRPMSHPSPGYRYPFTPYPTGWYYIAQLSDIKPGKAVPIQCLGKDFVLFRGDSGNVFVADAFCPHLGAHLGVGGTVKGDCITCPFHAWCFDGNTGKCVDIPYNPANATIPPQAQLQLVTTKEKNGLIFIWHSTKGHAPQPTFDLPDIPETRDNAHWDVFRLQFRSRLHIQEAAENALDTGHFTKVHAFETHPEVVDFTVDGPRFRVLLESKRKLLGEYDRPQVDITFYGLGFLHSKVHAKYVDLSIMLTYTPISEEYCDINMFVRIRKTNWLRDLVLRWYLPYHIGMDYSCDIPVWENKVYITNPVLCKGDGQIPAVRRWSRQFYGNGAWIGEKTENNLVRNDSAISLGW